MWGNWSPETLSYGDSPWRKSKSIRINALKKVVGVGFLSSGMSASREGRREKQWVKRLHNVSVLDSRKVKDDG